MSDNMRRRAFLGGALAAAGSGLLGGRVVAGEGKKAPARDADSATRGVAFPKGFHWGAATSSYQIEGAWDADGKGESVWDRFVRQPGKVKDGATGDVACDHYHRFAEDVKLVKALGLTSYRFSIAWPRIQATGSGPANTRGLDFYRRLIDALLAEGIRPFPTLYHWDLPQALEDKGGWESRDTAGRFADYAEICAKALGDGVGDWMVFNEPGVFTLLGYGLGMHAPGKADLALALRTTHVVNLAQGDAFRALRATLPAKVRLGGAWAMTAMEPADPQSEADKDAARRWHLFFNAWFLDPALRGRYPDVFPAEQMPALGIQPGDLERARASFDFIGVNNYTRYLITTEAPSSGGLPGQMKGGEEGPKTENGWEVWPKGFHDVVLWAWNEYRLPIEITENGCAYNDAPDASGRVRDERRIDYYRGYLAELQSAIQDGADVRGYHAWSLLDNFEWAEGYTQRFGIVHVDFASQKRTIKDSGHWLARVASRNALP